MVNTRNTVVHKVSWDIFCSQWKVKAFQIYDSMLINMCQVHLPKTHLPTHPPGFDVIGWCQEGIVGSPHRAPGPWLVGFVLLGTLVSSEKPCPDR